MIIKPQKRICEQKENLRGGKGALIFENFLKKDQYPDHFRVFCEMVIQPGCSVGQHSHVGECEFYFMTEGEAIYNDNGTEYTVCAGDMTVCFDGEFHALENRSDKIVRAIACVITK